MIMNKELSKVVDGGLFFMFIVIILFIIGVYFYG